MNLTVFSRGPSLYSTSRIVEAAEADGHQVEVVDHASCSPVLENGAHSLLFDGRPMKAPELVIPRIGAHVTLRGAALLRHLDLMGIPHTMNAAALQLARDKMGSLQVLAAAGIPVPQTTLCFTIRDVRLAVKRMGGYPVVLKMLESTHGVGVALAYNLFQLERIAEGFLQLQQRVILQEYIEESEGRDIRSFVVGDKIIATMERRAADGEFRANMHRGASAIPIELGTADQEIVLTAARTLGVEIAGVDLIPSKQGYLLMEVNASPGLEGIERTTNQDIASEIVRYAVNKANK